MNARRTIALALTLGASALAVAAPAHAAAPAAAPAAFVQTAVNPSNIDPNAQTTLDIHKYLGSPTGQVANGTAVSVNLPALQGVPFDVYQVMDPTTGKAVDLTTNSGWAAATDLQGVTLSAANVASGTITGKSGTVYTLTLKSTVVTDNTGDAKYTQTGPGLFFVNENLSKATTITNVATGATVAPSSITPAAPFLVTLPMTDPSGTSWMYTVNAYPKNTSDSITKTVKDQSTITTAQGTSLTSNASSIVTYGLTGTITPGMTGTQMGAYALVDQLPKGETFSSVANVKAGTTALTAGTDYLVWVNGQQVTSPQPQIDGPLVQITMTQSGLDKLAAAKAADPAATVTADLLVVSTLPAGDLLNTANLIPSNSWWQSFTGNPTATYNPADGDTPTSDNGTPVTGTPISSNQVDTKIGSALLTKTDAQNGAVLGGAVFDLYSMVIAGNLTAPTAGDCANAVIDPAHKVMSGLTTASNGTLTINGLQESDFYNNVQQPATGGQYIVYCLVETQAPSGYNLNAQPTAFYVTGTSTPVAVSVQDEKTNLANALPLTGGAGASALSLGGLVVVGGTLAARAASRKRRDEENELA